MSHHEEIPKTSSLGPDRSLAIEAELSTLGATHPALWTAFFEMGQAIQASKPIATAIPGWSTICGSVQDLYRLSLKDPREFALVQTMMTVMHQDRTKEEIIRHLSLSSGGAAHRTGNNPPEEDEDPKVQMSEIRKEIERVSSRINEQASSFQSLQTRVDQLVTNVGAQPERVPTDEAFCISHGHIQSIEKVLAELCGSVQVEADRWKALFYSRYGRFLQLHVKFNDFNFKQAEKYSDPGVPIAVMVVLTAMVKGFCYNREGMKEVQKEIGKSYRLLNPVDPCVERVVRNSIRRNHYYCNGDCGQGCSSEARILASKK